MGTSPSTSGTCWDARFPSITIAPMEARARFEYDYDMRGLLTQATTPDGVIDYAYDALGQLTMVELPDGRQIEYQYDVAGNRRQVIDDGLATAYQPEQSVPLFRGILRGAQWTQPADLTLKDIEAIAAFLHGDFDLIPRSLVCGD